MTPVQESDYWDHIAGDSRRIEAEVWSDLEVNECVDMILPALNLDVQTQVVELGCGVGRLTCPIAEMIGAISGRITGVDISPRMVELARQICTRPNATFVIGDGRVLEPGWSSSFDAAYSMTTFQHIPHDAQEGYLWEIRRVLVEGGKFRLQFVFEGDEAPFNYPTTVKQMLAWCDKAGLAEIAVTLGRMKPAWCWLTLVKR